MTMTEPRITRMTSAVHPRRIRMRRIRRLPVRMASITMGMGRSITRRIRDVPRSRIMMSSMLSRNAVTEWTMTMTEPRITRMTSAVHPRRIRMRRIRRLPVRMASITIAMGRSITRRIRDVPRSRIMMSSMPQQTSRSRASTSMAATSRCSTPSKSQHALTCSLRTERLRCIRQILSAETADRSRYRGISSLLHSLSDSRSNSATAIITAIAVQA